MSHFRIFLSLLLAVFVAFTTTACFPLPAESEVETDQLQEVTLHISGFTFSQFPDTRAAADLAARIDIALFDEDGTKVAKVNQKSDDADFANPKIRVGSGTYTLVVIAHSSTGVATITSPSQVTFPNNKVSDTFYHLSTLVVGEEPTSDEVKVKRAVSMVRILMTDTDLPDDFAQLQIYYTGGSSTFDPTTGFGSKNSRQTEIRQRSEAMTDAEGHLIFEFYTFPHEQADELKVTLSALDANSELIATAKVIEHLPVHYCEITQIKGELFSEGSTFVNNSITITFDAEWKNTTTIEF